MEVVMNKPMISIAILGVLIGACAPDDSADGPDSVSSYDPEPATTDEYEVTEMARSEPGTERTNPPTASYETEPQQNPATTDPEAGSDPVFSELDADADGSISPKEAAAEPFVLDNFQAADADRDGLLNSSEFDRLKDETEDSE
jgi:hypothetical protein